MKSPSGSSLPIARKAVGAVNNAFTLYSLHTRQKARKKLVQALYQWHITGSSPREIEKQFLCTV